MTTNHHSPMGLIVTIKQQEETTSPAEEPTCPSPDNKSPTKVKKEEKSIKKRCSSAKLSKKLWKDRIEECRAFRQTHGHCKIPTTNKENKSLGIWVQETRRNMKLMMTPGKAPRRKLTHEQLEDLKEVGFDWGKFKPDLSKMPETDESWQKRVDELKAYQKEHGHFDVPYNTNDEAKQDDKKNAEMQDLGRWTRIQRHQYNLRQTKRKSTLTAARVKALDAIGFDWDGPRTL